MVWLRDHGQVSGLLVMSTDLGVQCSSEHPKCLFQRCGVSCQNDVSGVADSQILMQSLCTDTYDKAASATGDARQYQFVNEVT